MWNCSSVCSTTSVRAIRICASSWNRAVAFAWQTGPLVAQVVDVVENAGVKTAIFNASFTCHMPDCLEMPYHRLFAGRRRSPTGWKSGTKTDDCVYRLGGNSCLSGDFMGYWRFARPLQVGDELIFEDMIHYTTVKTNMFNGIHHPLALFASRRRHP